MTLVTDVRDSDMTVDSTEIVTSIESIEINTSTQPEQVVTSVNDTLATVATVGSSVVTTVVGQQGPPGIDGIGTASFSAVNKQGSTLPAGTPVATHSSGVGFVSANATDDTKPAVGLLTTSVNSLAAGSVQTSGPITLSDWTAITGSTTLVAKGRYYLSTSGGLLTTSPPVTTLNIVQLIGVAVSDDTLDIQIWDHVIL